MCDMQGIQNNNEEVDEANVVKKMILLFDWK
jgi:hypothetical protein